MSAVALVGFAACSEGLNGEGIRVEANTEEVSIFAEFSEDDTRMTLNNKPPEWEQGDVITINGFEFVAQESGTSVQFKGKVDESLIGAAFTAYYGGEHVAAAQVAREGDMPKATPAKAEGAAFESGMTIEFKNIAALLKFTPTFAGDVTFTYIVDSKQEAITLTGCAANKEYYVAVTPGSWSEGLTVTTDYILCKSTTKSQTINRSTMYDLGGISKKEYTWGLVGQHQGWDVTKPTPMYYTTNSKVFALKNIMLKDNGFKFAKQGLSDWNTANTTFGAWKDSTGKGFFNYSTEMGQGAWYSVYTNNLGGQSKNIGVSDFNKSYDVYIKVIQDQSWGQELGYTVVPAGTTVSF